MLRELQRNVTTGSSRIKTALSSTDVLLNQFNELVDAHQAVVNELKVLTDRFDNVNAKYVKLSSSVPPTDQSLQTVRDTLAELERQYAELLSVSYRHH